MDLMKRSYQQIIEVAEAHKIVVNIEPHGYFTTKPEMMARMLAFCDSPYLRMNLDTGNTFIAGQDPVAFLGRFIDRLNHVHVKDVSPSLAAATRGKQTGIPVSHCALGDGVNADNIKKCFVLLRDHGYDGVLSMECEGQGGPMIERSLNVPPRHAGRIEDPGRRFLRNMRTGAAGSLPAAVHKCLCAFRSPLSMVETSSAASAVRETLGSQGSDNFSTARVPTARKTGSEIVSLMNRTEPSLIANCARRGAGWYRRSDCTIGPGDSFDRSPGSSRWEDTHVAMALSRWHHAFW